MKWKVVSERTIHSNPWLDLNLADVELPDGRHLDHYVLRQRPVAATAILNDQDEVLLLWRHRFITDTWGWEIPAGVVDEGETPIETAAREAEEETGWRVKNLRPLFDLEPANGLGDCVHHVFVGNSAEHTGPPEDTHESESVKWIQLADVPGLVGRGEIRPAPPRQPFCTSTSNNGTNLAERRPLRAVPVLNCALAGFEESHARDKALYLSYSRSPISLLERSSKPRRSPNESERCLRASHP